ncbi:DNA/RNA non-specific endonuclease, partial [Methylobacterium indicum]
FRYYDPLTAHYASPDPIGLAGGTRSNSYVLSPAIWVDPLGLVCCPKITRDSIGRPIEWKGQAGPNDIGTGTATNPTTREYARSLGRATDDAGHAQGRLLGGTGTNIDNIFPQTPNINRGAFREFEKTISKQIISTGQTADLNLRANYVGNSNRPVSLDYVARFPNGTVLSQTFPNP